MQTSCVDNGGESIGERGFSDTRQRACRGRLSHARDSNGGDNYCVNNPSFDCYSDAHMLLVDTAPALVEGYYTGHDTGSTPVWTFASTVLWDLSSNALRPSG